MPRVAETRQIPAAPIRLELWSARTVRACRRVWVWLGRQQGLKLLHPRARRLEVHETVQLGEKRFVSILRVDDEQFLIGGSPSGVSLLASLRPDSRPSFSSVLEEAEGKQACA